VRTRRASKEKEATNVAVAINPCRRNRRISSSAGACRLAWAGEAAAGAILTWSVLPFSHSMERQSVALQQSRISPARQFENLFRRTGP